MILDKPLDQWLHSHPLLGQLTRLEPLSWFNPALAPTAQALGDVPLTLADVDDASARLDRFASYLRVVFPETEASAGIIESPLLPLPRLHAALCAEANLPVQGALFNASQQRRINDALNQLQGRSINLDIQLCKPEQETPAQAAARKRGERQAQAEASIHADPLIQQMQQQFAAVIRAESIVPVDGVAA